MYYNNLFDDSTNESSKISKELKDVSSELHNAQRKFKHTKNKGGKKKKLKKSEKKIKQLKKERKYLKKELEGHKCSAKHKPPKHWWVGTVEKSVPKLIDLATAIIKKNSKK